MRESGYTLGFRRRITHSGSHGETGGLPSLVHSAALCCQRYPFYSTTLLYTYISLFSVAPHYRQKRKSRRRCHRNSVPNRSSSRFSTSRTNAPCSLSCVKAGTHSAFGEESHTAAYTPKQGHSLPRPQCGFALPVNSFLFRHAFIYIHFPVHCEPPLSAERKIRRNCRHKFYPQPFLIPVFNFSHKRPTFAFTPESGYTLGLRRKIAHKRLHAETGGVSDGVLLLPSDCFTRFGNPAWPGGRTANCAAFGSWPGALSKNAESLRNSDALMRVAVPQASRPRWVA